MSDLLFGVLEQLMGQIRLTLLELVEEKMVVGQVTLAHLMVPREFVYVHEILRDERLVTLKNYIIQIKLDDILALRVVEGFGVEELP